MLRGIILLALAAGLALLAAPFVMSSLDLDDRGIPIPGVVSSRSESVRVHYSGWERSFSVSIQYAPPESGGVSFFNVNLDAASYDALHTGETVPLRYLRVADTPQVPMARGLRELHALPVARLADRRAFSGVKVLFTKQVIMIGEVIGGIATMFLIWRFTRVPAFGWAAAFCCAAGLAILLIRDLPSPTPPPSVDIRQATGRVKSLDRIDRLFQGTRERGMVADQPVDVVGIEFVPAGWTQPVVAVDLIDQGSLPGLKENADFAIDYEGRSPRTAYIRGATRNFVSRNMAGIAEQSVAYVAVMAVFFLGAQFAGRAFNRLIGRSPRS